MKRRCAACGIPHSGTVWPPHDCLLALKAEVERLNAKVADMRGEVERMRRERNAALAKVKAEIPW